MNIDLRSFGLNKYENAAYLALVQEGISTALEIARYSAVPHGKIYPTLNSLESKNFVKKYDGTPQKFMAIPPEVAIEEFTRKKEVELREFKARSESIVTKLKAITGRKTKEPLDSIKILEGYKNYLNLSVELHKKTKKEWCTISELSTYEPHIKAYREAIKRGVKIRILTSETEANETKLSLWKNIGVEIRYIEYLSTKFSVNDDTDVTFRFAGQKKYVSLWIQNQSLAVSMESLFNSLWKFAKTPNSLSSG